MGEGTGADTVTSTSRFSLGKTEVTPYKWEKVMGTKPWGGSGDKPDADFRTVNVHWDDMTEFCRELTDRGRANRTLQSDNGYRLPTEAEWEHACRAGTMTAYSFGDDESRLDEFAWLQGNSEGKVHPVGTKNPNL
jgi:formylglycine-generating enzyme required for sulfatase activity